MPRGSVPRYKIIRARIGSAKGEVIKRYDRSKYSGYHVPKEVILQDIRHFYKTKHPSIWERMQRRRKRRR